MFILTAKFNRKKAIAIIVALAVLLIAIILIAANTGKNKSTENEEAAALSAVVKNNEQRVNYLNALGWEVEKTPVEEQTVVIPRAFTDVYEDYNALQKAQGFDLSTYGGLEAVRYTYKVLNYPDTEETVVADIIVYRNEVIAGDIQSNALDGFMVGLEFPSTDTVQTNLTDTESAEDVMSPTEVPDDVSDVSPSSDSNAGNAADTTPDNAADNAADNTADNAADNTADNTMENEPESTADTVPGENASIEDSTALEGETA